MYIAIAVALIILSFVFHELGHALAMRSCGVEIAEMGLGFGPKLISGRITRYFGDDTKFAIRLLPLGAYVRPSENGGKTMEGLSYSDSARIAGAGILANFAFAFCILIGLALTRNPIFPNPGIVQPLLVLGGGTILLRFGRKFVVPLVGTAFLAYVVFLIVTHGGPAGVVGGPVVIGKVVVAEAINLRHAIWIAGFLSFSIGLMNTIPILPFDGGQMIKGIAEEGSAAAHSVPREFQYSGVTSSSRMHFLHRYHPLVSKRMIYRAADPNDRAAFFIIFYPIPRACAVEFSFLL